MFDAGVPWGMKFYVAKCNPENASEAAPESYKMLNKQQY